MILHLIFIFKVPGDKFPVVLLRIVLRVVVVRRSYIVAVGVVDDVIADVVNVVVIVVHIGRIIVGGLV